MTTASENVLIGNNVAAALTTGNQNIIVGDNAAAGAAVTGNANTIVGDNAGYYLTSGANNCFHGGAAGHAITTGNNNVAVGHTSGAGITEGDGNVCVGQNAGDAITTGTNNIMIGLSSDPSGGTNDNELVIGTNSAAGKGDTTGFIAPSNGGVYQGNNSSSWSTTSDRRIKKNIVDNDIGLEAINQVRVRNFEYRTPDEIDELPKESAIDKEGLQLGVIAQEIQTVLPDVVKQESTGCYSVNPDNMTWYLVNAVKELSTQVNELKDEIKTLKGK
jgi:hypothetical protein